MSAYGGLESLGCCFFADKELDVHRQVEPAGPPWFKAEEEPVNNKRGRADDESGLRSWSLENLSIQEWGQLCEPDVRPLIHTRRMDAFYTIDVLHRSSIRNMVALPESVIASSIYPSNLLPRTFPHPTLVCKSPNIICLAFAVFDKFVASGVLPGSNHRDTIDFWSSDTGCFTNRKVHTLRTFAAACYMIAWKMEVGNVDLLSVNLYNNVLMTYKMDGCEQLFKDLNEVQIFEERVSERSQFTVLKSAGGDTIELAELVVLRDCDWRVRIPTLVDVVDELFDGKHDTPQWIQLRSLCYDIAVKLTLCTSIVYNKHYTILKGACLVVGEACLRLKFPFDGVPGIQKALGVATNKRLSMQ